MIRWTLSYRNHTFRAHEWHTYSERYETAEAAFRAASGLLAVTSEGALPDIAFRIARVETTRKGNAS